MAHLLLTNSHDSDASLFEVPPNVTARPQDGSRYDDGIKRLRQLFQRAADIGEDPFDGAHWIEDGKIVPASITSNPSAFDGDAYADVTVHVTVVRDGAVVEVTRFGYRIDGRS